MTRKSGNRAWMGPLAALLAALAPAPVNAQTSGGSTSGGGTTGGTSTSRSTGSTTGGSLGTGTTSPRVGPSATQPGGASPQTLPGPNTLTPGSSQQLGPRPGATSPTLSEPTPRSLEPGQGSSSGIGTGSNTTTEQPQPGSSSTRANRAATGAGVGGGAPVTSTQPQGADMTFDDCMNTWSPATHMSREAFAESCRRVKDRDVEVSKQ